MDERAFSERPTLSRLAHTKDTRSFENVLGAILSYSLTSDAWFTFNQKKKGGTAE
jgi:hypothetical protein